MSGIICEYRDLIISKMIDVGFLIHGFRDGVREKFQEFDDEEWAGYVESGEYEGEERGESMFRAPCWPQPTGWRILEKKDRIDRDWIVVECVDPITSRISDNKLERYAELWFYLDSLDQLIVLHLYLMDEKGGLHKIDLKRVFFEKLTNDVERREVIAKHLGVVDDSIFGECDGESVEN